MRKRLSVWFIFSLLCMSLEGTGQVFSRVEKNNARPSVSWQKKALSKIYALDTIELEKALFEEKTLSIPLTNGEILQFDLKANTLIPQEIKSKYSYGSWDAMSKDGKYRAKIDFTHHGIRAMIFSEEINFFLEPIALGEQHYVQVFSTQAHHSHDAFSCYSHGAVSKELYHSDQNDGVIGANKRTLDIAVAATGEYTRFYGGTVADGLSGIITTMNRVNAVYEKDLAISFRLVPDNELLVFTDPQTDPYTNGDLSDMLSENQSTLNAVIGSANYDIGHVFGTSGGGLARINSVCRASDKAKGVTGLITPQGDIFNVDYVCHEIGHQLGGHHTFNNCDGDWGGNYSFEPGSGTSIMSYAGICGPTNVQAFSDQHFHIGNLIQMTNSVNSCADIENSNNYVPEVFLNSPTGLIAPVSTPFVLDGFAIDADDTQLDYSWDQMDVSRIEPYGESNFDGPLFRYIEPSPSQNRRYFPSLHNLIDGDHPEEVLPEETRTINFNLTARDNHPEAGAVAYKNYSLDFTESAGPFSVTYPSAEGINFQEGDFITVEWDVSNTDLMPVNCQLVSILLSIDGGLNYDIILNGGTENDGSEDVALPFVSSKSCRIMVKAMDHVFFNISDNDFEIGENPDPEILLLFEDTVFQVCNDNSLNIDFRVEGVNNYTHLTELSIIDPPSFLQFFFDPATAFRTNRDVVLQIFNISSLIPGEYDFKIQAQSLNGEFSAIKTIKLSVQDDRPDAPQLTTPSDLEFYTDNSIPYSWFSSPMIDQYHLQIAIDRNFENTVLDTVLSENTLDFSAGAFGVLYSRISGINLCGEGDFSAPIRYHVSGNSCISYRDEVNFDIPLGAPSFNLFELEVEQDFMVEKLRLKNIEGQHDNTAVLEFKLFYPDGEEKSLITLPCLDETDYLFGISDESSFGFSCPFDRNIIYRGEELLNDPLPMSSQGTWSLQIINNDATMTGSVKEWTLELCGDQESDSASIQKKRDNILQVPLSSMAIIHDEHVLYESTGFPSDDIVLKIKSLPLHGGLLLEGQSLKEGDWIVQEDLFNRLLSYQHSNAMFRRDSFFFDVLVNGVGIKQDQRFDIFIANGSMNAQAIVTQEILCPDINDGEVSITVSGGVPPYEYGIQGLAYQTDSVFSGLSPNYYVFTVRDQMGSEIALPGINLEGKISFTMDYEQNGRDIVFHIMGGEAPYLYSLDGGLLLSDSVFVDLNPGAHRLKIIDQLNCEKEFIFNFEFKTVSINLKSLKPSLCHDSEDGEIAVGATGGLKPYRFSINDGPLSGDSIFASLTPGFYNVKVIDALNEFDELLSLEVISPSPITASTTILDRDIYVNATGGTGQYVYNIDGQQFTTNSVFENVSYGPHVIGIKDQHSCYTDINVNVLEQPILIQYQWNQTLDCHNDSTGQLEIIATGGYPPFEYALNQGDYQEEAIFDLLHASNYSIYVRDDQGQIQVLNGVILENPEELKATLNYINDSLFVSVSGGYPPYYIAIDNSSHGSDSVFTGLGQGTHQVSVLDANDCELIQDFSINTSPLSVSINVLEEPSCADSEDGVLIVTGSGGVSPYEYSLNNINYQESNVFTGLSSRSYVAYLKDADGTIGLSAPVMMESPLPLVASVYTREDTARIEAFGGTPPIRTSVDGSPFDTLDMYTGLDHGEHELILLDANDCEKIISFNIKTTDQQELADEKISIYPNPARNEIYIESVSSNISSTQIRVFNKLGQLVIIKDFLLGEDPLDISGLTPDSYLLELNTNNGIVQKPLIVTE